MGIIRHYTDNLASNALTMSEDLTGTTFGDADILAFFNSSTTLAAQKTTFYASGKAAVTLNNLNNTFALSAVDKNITFDIHAGNGNDTIKLTGSLAKNTVTLGTGTNIVQTGLGSDIINTGTGATTVTVSGSAIVHGGTGNDTVTVNANNAFIDGGDGTNTINVNSKASTIVLDTHFTKTTVSNFKVGTSKFQIDRTVFSSFQDFLNNAKNVGGNIVATAHDGSQLVISGRTLAQMKSTDFTFTGTGAAFDKIVTLANGTLVDTFYNASAQVTQVRDTYADGSHETFVYNTPGQAFASYSEVYDKNFVHTGEHIFDALGNVTQSRLFSTDAAGDHITKRLNASNLVMQVITDYSDGHHVTSEYNIAGQAFPSYAEVFDASYVHTAELIYDALGNVSQSRLFSMDAFGDHITQRLDGNNQLMELQIDYVDGHHAFSEYNTPGQAFPSYVNTFDSSWNLTSQVVYDATGHVIP